MTDFNLLATSTYHYIESTETMSGGAKDSSRRVFRSTPPKVGLEQGLELEEIGTVSIASISTNNVLILTRIHTKINNFLGHGLALKSYQAGSSPHWPRTQHTIP